jgi:hypothetical protein
MNKLEMFLSDIIGAIFILIASGVLYHLIYLVRNRQGVNPSALFLFREIIEVTVLSPIITVLVFYVTGLVIYNSMSTGAWVYIVLASVACSLFMAFAWKSYKILVTCFISGICVGYCCIEYQSVWLAIALYPIMILIVVCIDLFFRSLVALFSNYFLSEIERGQKFGHVGRMP